MEPFWRIIYTPPKGKPLQVRLTANDLSNQRMREMKARFGASYGIPAEYISLLLRGDMDAVACAIWIGQQKAGVEVTDPREMDFTLDDLEALQDPEEDEGADGEDGEKEKRPTRRRTPDSDKTSTPSEPPGSSTSTTSAD